jgi:8-oxo-dGTP pyrophosphatase MutT (NUDIX family)
MNDIEVFPLARLELCFEPRPWPWALANRSAIGAHFATARRSKPGLWNGRVLLLHRWAIECRLFRGAFLETDFASFMTWRDTGFPDRTVANCFAMGALRSRDGAYVLGVMNSHTSNAGLIYFPSGTPDPQDLRADGSVDLIGSVQRELHQETGLLPEDAPPGPLWHGIISGPRIALMRPLLARDDAARLTARIRANLARERQPELSDIVVVRDLADLRPEMPDFVRAYIAFNARPGAWRSVSAGTPAFSDSRIGA